MIGKLFADENRTVLPLVGWVTLIFFLLNVGSAAVAISIDSSLAVVLSVIALISAFGYLFFIPVLLGYCFYVSCYSERGYLTAVLPAKSSTIYSVKACYAAAVAFVSSLLGFAMAILGYFCLEKVSGSSSESEVLNGVLDFLRWVSGNVPLYIIFLVATMLVLLMATSFAGYFFAVALGGTGVFKTLGIGGAVVSWIIFYAVSQVAPLLGLFLPPSVVFDEGNIFLHWASPMLAGDQGAAGFPLSVLLIIILLNFGALFIGQRLYSKCLDLR